MKKVAFLFDGNDLKFIVNYFEKYHIDTKKVDMINNPSLIAGAKDDIDSDILNNETKYEYKNTIIQLFNNKSDIDLDTFDKIYKFETYHRGTKYTNSNNDSFERILINLGERTSESYELKNEINGHKLISGSKIKGNNIFYDFKLNLIYFYYYYGFNYLRYKYRRVNKDNMLGMYWFPKYKVERDNQVKSIQSFTTFDIDFYSKADKMNVYEKIRTIDRDNWDKNHISSWTDYETSVVGYVFETLHHSIEYESIHRLEYISEKTLKPLLFSFLKMPFILDCNPYSFIDLTKDGYWFLNSEFFTYEESDNYEIIIEKFSNALDKTIVYLEDLYKSYSLDEVSDIIYEKYKRKIDTNFKKIIEDVNNPKNGDLFIDFILN